MHNHWLFLVNAFAHLVASMSGLVSFCIAVYEAFHKKKFETWAFFSIGALCLIVAFDQAWQDEHRNSQLLEGEKAAISSDRNFWKDQSYSKDDSLRQRDQILAQNYTALIGEQATSNKTQDSLTRLSNKILEINKPEPQRFTIRRNDDPEGYVLQTFKRHMQMVVMSNRPVAANFIVGCEQAIPFLDAHILEGGPKFPDSVMKVTDNEWMIRIPSPQITPQNPLLIQIGYNGDNLGKCGVFPR